MRTIVVQPSLSTAKAVSQYVSSKGVPAAYARCAKELPDGRALVYTNSGAAVDMVLRGKIQDSDVVVVDEAHSPTFTHAMLLDLLSRMQVPVVLMTALLH